MDAQTHLKDLCGFLRRRATQDRGVREGVISEYWTGAADHIEMMFAREAALRAEVESLTKQRDALRTVAVDCFAHLGKEIERKTLNQSADDGTQALSARLARVLDAVAVVS